MVNALGDDGAEMHPSLKEIFAAELFAKLSAEDQDTIIAQTKALLSHG